MCIVSGTLRPTPLPWLPVLSHITFPHLRRTAATSQLLTKIRSSTVTLPLMSDIESHPEIRLKSSVNTTELERRVGYLRRNQPLTGRGPFHHTPWIRPTSTLVVNVVPLSDWPGSMCSQPRPLESDFRPILLLWSVSTDYVTYCERLSAHDDLRILYDFTFYVPHSTSDDVSSLFVMFFARTIRYF